MEIYDLKSSFKVLPISLSGAPCYAWKEGSYSLICFNFLFFVTNLNLTYSGVFTYNSGVQYFSDTSRNFSQSMLY